MKRWRILPGMAIALLVPTIVIFAQSTDPNKRKPPLEMANYDWQKDAHASGLTAEQMVTLHKQGFVVTGNTCRQAFFPYLNGEQLFVTSDAIANSYSVLLEESVRLLEATNARRLNTFLVEAWKVTPSFQKRFTGDPSLLQVAYNRVRMTMGVALELSSGQKVDASPDIEKAIDDEAQRVIAATGQSKPEWLGPPDAGFEAIDYTRFKPRGVYNGRPALERYFRATAWLQAIPFRFSKDEEFAAWLMLYEGLDDFDNKPLYNSEQEICMKGPGEADSMKSALMMLVGEPDDTDLFGSGHEGVTNDGWDAKGFNDLRQQWANRGPGAEDGTVHLSQINDQISIASKDGKPERTFRILSAYRLPDAAMFTDTEQIHAGAFPSGREVAAALGSPIARAFYNSDNEKLLAQIDKDKNAFAEGTLYDDYLNAMATLFEPVDAAAPDLFHSSAWQEKSLQTFLGGWAQDRHAWLLQAKQNVIMLGMGEIVPSGFVEPVPDFFNRMAQLSLKSLQIFQDAGAYNNGIEEVVQNYRDTAAALHRYAAARKIDPKARPTGADAEVLMNNEGLMYALSIPGKPMPPEEETAAKLEQMATQLETQGPGNDPELKMQIEFKGSQTAKKWQEFASLCLKLEELSNKQLHHRPLSDEDNQFYYDFGSTLASFMGYDSNEFNDVHDDAPRIADIYSAPQTGQVMEVGIGRPLVMYLLYPYGGKLILTHGAVLPYYEFASGERLNDQTWADLLKTPAAPAPPDWLRDVTSKPIPAVKPVVR